MSLSDEDYEKDRQDWNDHLAKLRPDDIVPAIKLALNEISYLRQRVRDLEAPNSEGGQQKDEDKS